MEFPHFLDPDQARSATAAGFGSFVFLAVTRNLGWAYVLTLFGVGQVTAYYFAAIVAHAVGWSTQAVAFPIGALSMLAWGSAFHLFQSLHDDPQGTVSWAWRLWRGGGERDRSGDDDRRDGGGIP